MIDDAFDKELETIRKRRTEELKMSAEKSWPDSPVNVTDMEFKDFIKKYPRVIVDCWAPWCGPCRNLIPIIDELAKAYKGKVVFGKVNIDENQQVPNMFDVQAIPTLLFFKDGEMVEKSVGAPPRPTLEGMINKFVK